MLKHYNHSALHEEPRSKRAQILLIRESESLYNWIKSTGRFKSYESDEPRADALSEELDDIMETEIYRLDKEEEEDGEELYL